MNDTLLSKNYAKIIISTLLAIIIYILVCLPFYFIPIIGTVFSRILFVSLTTNYFYKLCSMSCSNEDVFIINNILPNHNIFNHILIYLLSFLIYTLFEKISVLVCDQYFSILIFGICFLCLNILKTSFIIYSIENTNLIDGIVAGIFLINKRPLLYIPLILIMYGLRFIPYCGICISYAFLLFIEYVKISNYINNEKY